MWDNRWALYGRYFWIVVRMMETGSTAAKPTTAELSLVIGERHLLLPTRRLSTA